MLETVSPVVGSAASRSKWARSRRTRRREPFRLMPWWRRKAYRNALGETHTAAATSLMPMSVCAFYSMKTSALWTVAEVASFRSFEVGSPMAVLGNVVRAAAARRRAVLPRTSGSLKTSGLLARTSRT
jgi:hypothetical protein